MNLLELLLIFVVAGICGAIGEFVVGFKPGGMFISVIIGVIGAYIGNLLARVLLGAAPNLQQLLLIHIGTITFDLVWATLGSILVVFALSALRYNKGLRFSRRR